MQPEEAVKSAVEEFGMQVRQFLTGPCRNMVGSITTLQRLNLRLCLQGADLTGIIKSADGGNIDRLVFHPATS